MYRLVLHIVIAGLVFCRKNNIKDAIVKFSKIGYAESASSGEAAMYWAHRNALKIAGADIHVDGREEIVARIPIKHGANVVLRPTFACVLADVKEKIKGPVKISNTSTLILQGISITIRHLELDGALVVRVGNGAQLIIDAVVKNAGWAPEEVNLEDSNVDEKYRIRGYNMKKTKQFLVYLTEEKGKFLLTNTNTGEH